MRHVVNPGPHGGYQILRVAEDRTCTFVGLFGDLEQARRIAEWLDLQDRITQLLDRHSHVDCPLDRMGQA